LNGKRIRRNFKNRSEAVSERQRLEVRYLNETSDGQTIFTTLTADQNKDAIAAVSLLHKSGIKKSLIFAVNYLLDHYQEAAETKSVDDAIVEYRQEKEREMDRGILSSRQFDSIFDELATFRTAFEGQVIGEIQPEELKRYLEGKQEGARRARSLKTWNNRRGYLSTFFKFCLSRKFVAEDPVISVPIFKIKNRRGTAETFSAKQTQDLMQWLESYRGKQNKDGSWWAEPGSLVPYFALTFFAGIRPDWRTGEILKLKEKDIHLDTGVILIEPETSKVNEKRQIKIQPNLRLWLEKYPISRYPIVKTHRFHSLWADVRKTFELPHDVMRHTYISMTVGAFRSVGDTALQAGNSEAIIRQHYLDLKSETEADTFWRIVPQGMALPASMEKRDGRYIDAHK
jgi:integrase